MGATPRRRLRLLLSTRSTMMLCISAWTKSMSVWTCLGGRLLRVLCALMKARWRQVHIFHVCFRRFSGQVRFQARTKLWTWRKTRLWQMFWFVQTDSKRNEGFLRLTMK
ncbi:hypothetical protein VPH35_015763 [Triticum aestivum]